MDGSEERKEDKGGGGVEGGRHADDAEGEGGGRWAQQKGGEQAHGDYDRNWKFKGGRRMEMEI